MKHKIFTTANVIVTGYSSTFSFFRLKIKPSLQCLAVVQRYFYNNLNIADRKFVVRSVFEFTIFNKFMTIVENQRKKTSDKWHLNYPYKRYTFCTILQWKIFFPFLLPEWMSLKRQVYRKGLIHSSQCLSSSCFMGLKIALNFNWCLKQTF